MNEVGVSTQKRVTVLVPSMLRGDCDGASRIDLDVDQPATLGDLLAALANRHPRLERRVRDEQGGLRRYVNVYVDGEESRRRDGLATPLRDGSEVHIVPSVAGG
ncbi:ubiquitin-like small modifier protein 1 [Actinopolymorpha sp. B17G11]|uniref:ubiquitin-like small modifier protein 1 n=1 Tax=Actinopolymorpha sp. B17G11 TaxID=3160861 RepID=UPI0032E4E5E1